MAEKMTPKESVLRSKSSENHWNFVSDEYESSLSEHFVPKNAKTSTNWAVTKFMDWVKGRNRQFIGDSSKTVHENILESGDKESYAVYSRNKEGRN